MNVTRWFGRSPWGPALEPEDEYVRVEQVPVPVGTACLSCGEEILEDDDGLMSYAYAGSPEAPTVSEVAQHRECLLLAVTGHLVGLCTCTDYGGMSKRAAAQEADRRFSRLYVLPADS